MHLKTLIVAAAVVGTTGFGVAARADDSMQHMGSKSGSMQHDPSHMKATGSTMSDADMRKVAIVVKDVDKKNHSVTFQAKISPEANIMENGNTMKIDQLKAGDEVRAAFDPRTGAVTSLEVMPKSSDTKKRDDATKKQDTNEMNDMNQ